MRHHGCTLALFTMLLALVGCGGSSVDLPEDVMTQDAYAVQWTEFKALDPDAGVKMLASLADGMPDDQPKARLWLSAEADDVEGSYRERWEAFTDAGCTGMLTVFYRVESTEGEGENKRTTVSYQRHTFIKAKKDTDTGDLKKALEPFAEEDRNAKILFEEVGKDSGWFWVTQEDAPNNAPPMPEDGDEDTAKAFKKLIAEAGDAPIVSAWRMIEPIGGEIAEELKRDEVKEDDERKAALQLAKATETVVMYCDSGASPESSVVVVFTERDDASAFADKHNDRLVTQRGGIKRAMINVESPPHPSVIDGLIENMSAKASGKTVTLMLGRREIEDMLNLMAASRAAGGDDTSPASALAFDAMLHVPGSADVPGVRSCYDALVFGRNRLPQ